MNTWLKSILTGLGVAIVGLVLFAFIPALNKKYYRVGYLVHVQRDPVSSRGIEELVLQARNVLERRIAGLGYKASIHQLDDESLDVIVSRVTDTSMARQAIEANYQLEFRELYLISELFSSIVAAQPATEKYFPAPGGESNDVFNKRNIASLIAFSIGSDGRLADNGTLGTALTKDTALINKMLGDPEVLKAFPRDIEFRFGPRESTGKTKEKQTMVTIYAVRTRMQEAPLQGQHVEFAEASQDMNGRPEVLLQFNTVGTRKWERMTTENRNKYIAMIIDKKVISAPHVNEPIYGGSSSISGGFTKKETQALARQLNSGFLPARLAIIHEVMRTDKFLFNPETLLMIGILFLLASGVSLAIFNTLKRK